MTQSLAKTIATFRPRPMAGFGLKLALALAVAAMVARILSVIGILPALG